MPRVYGLAADYSQGEGDRKVVPQVSADALRKMASTSPETAAALEEIITPMLSMPPISLGFPDKNNQSSYYPGNGQISRDDIAAVAKVMEKHLIEPENTRLRKVNGGPKPSFEILQASTNAYSSVTSLDGADLEAGIFIRPGDHAVELSKYALLLRTPYNTRPATSKPHCCQSILRALAPEAWRRTVSRRRPG